MLNTRIIFLSLLALFLALNTACDQEGCTDPSADNYDPQADLDDGTCIYGGVIPGCTDATACNYEPSATSNGP